MTAYYGLSSPTSGLNPQSGAREIFISEQERERRREEIFGGCQEDLFAGATAAAAAATATDSFMLCAHRYRRRSDSIRQCCRHNEPALRNHTPCQAPCGCLKGANLSVCVTRASAPAREGSSVEGRGRSRSLGPS